MSWYGQGGTSNGGSNAGNQQSNQSFSSRITNFSDIADVSVEHIQFDDAPNPQQPPRPRPQQEPQPQIQVHQPLAYQDYHGQQAPAQAETSYQYGMQNNGLGRTESVVSSMSSGYQGQGSLNALGVGRSDTLVSAMSDTSRVQQQHLRPSESAISLQSQFDDHGQPLRGRESIVSLQSSYDPPTAQHDPYTQGHTYSGASTSSWTSFGSSGYQPVSVPSSAAPSRSQSRTSSHSSGSRGRARAGYSLGFSGGGHDAIPEEEIDMALLPAAADMGQASSYSAVPDNRPAEPAFDPTSTLGPMSFQDEEFVKKLQEQEASGRLTGGLGAGWKAERRLLGSDLLRQPSQMKRSLTRNFTRRLRKDDPVREMGQEEANKRGEVIEVVMDEPAGVDISAMVGPDLDDGGDTDSTRHSVIPRRKTTQTFYPQPNWKPFSMRWPYLVLLITLSIGLAVMSEILYQKSNRSPLLIFKDPNNVDPGIYFALKFLPTICAVTYGVLWQVTDFEVKRLEAFYQLSRPDGALAGESINVDYVTSKTFLRPIRATRLKHWAVAVSSFATLMAVSLVPTLGAASIKLTPSRDERIANPDIEKTVIISPYWSRLLTVILTFCAASGCVLLYLLQTRRSGLQNDVKGIAGLASMAVVSHMLMDFKDMDTAKHEDIHHKLKYRRYMLRNSALAPDDDNPVSSQAQNEGRFEHAHLSDNPHPVMLRAAGCIPFIIGVIVFMAFIPSFLFTAANVITDEAPWVITALAVIIKLSWGTLDTDVRMMEPFYLLYNRHAPSKTLTLDYTAMPFGYLPWRAFFNGHRIMFLVGAGSIMAEVLTILLTSLATVNGRDFLAGVKKFIGARDDDDDDEGSINSGQETVASFWVSLAFAMLILSYLAVVATVVFIRRRHPFLPRQPNTISSILAYIHQSKMLYDFVGTSKLNNAEMVTKLDEIGKTYGLGWFQGRDGQTHWLWKGIG